MIGLDTNILVRYFAQDDETQSPRATKIVEEQISRDEKGFASCIVLVELFWVLQKCYTMKPNQIVIIIDELLHAEDMVVENREEVWRAVQLVKTEGMDFADALLGTIHKQQGCRHTLTFDQDALKNDIFKAA